jgi:hypothetical protein
MLTRPSEPGFLMEIQMSMTLAESDAYWRERLNAQLVAELKAPEFSDQLHRAHSLGLLTELLESAGIPLARLKLEIEQTLWDRLQSQAAQKGPLDSGRAHLGQSRLISSSSIAQLPFVVG